MEFKESTVLASCLSFLKTNGIFCWRQNTGAFKTKDGGYFRSSTINGVSDIIGICPDGRFLAVECKRTKGGIVSDAQKDFLNKINAAGGVGIVVNSLESLVNQLEEKKVIKI